MNINIGTLNILDPDFAITHKQNEGLENGRSNWGSRKDKIVKLLKDASLDVVCLQEVSAQSFHDLKIDLEKLGYSCVHTPHSGRKDGLAILYKQKKFQQVHYVSFAKAGLDSCFVDLKDQATNKIIRVANCHLLGGGKPEGTAQIENLVNQVEKSPQYNIDARIIVGDFNEDQTKLNLVQTKFSALQKANYIFDGDLSPTEAGKNRKIDWLWIKVPNAQIAPIQIPQPIVSDHKLCASRVTFMPAPSSPLPAATPQVSAPQFSVPYSGFNHHQPPGSFRGMVMDNFEVTGWDDTLRISFKQTLDNILSSADIQKRNNPSVDFLNQVRQTFAGYVHGLNMTEAEKKMLIGDLEKAIRDALTAQNLPKPQVFSAPLASPSSAPAQPPITASAKPKAPKAAVVPPKNPAPVKAANQPSANQAPVNPVLTLRQRIKAFFRRIGDFFKKLFKMG